MGGNDKPILTEVSAITGTAVVQFIAVGIIQSPGTGTQYCTMNYLTYGINIKRDRCNINDELKNYIMIGMSDVTILIEKL